MESKSSKLLAPGFRFHPTDEELVRYYLRRKVCGKAFRYDAISEVDIYKAEPWDLPGRSRLRTRDLEWYFFSVLDKKYGNGSRTNRATDRGYWKTTGKDRPVYHKSQVVGMKKTLVYHSGRAPRGQRTNWVMHEYRLVDEELEKAGIVQDAFVLCRVFQKSGSGPKNGEQYGAPFVEEEWEDDELEMIPKVEADEVELGDDLYLDANDLDQILGTDIPSEDAPLPLNFCSGDNSNNSAEATNSFEENEKLSANSGAEYLCGPQYSDDQNSREIHVQYDADPKLVKHEYIGESSKNANSEDVDYLLDEPFLDATENFKFGDGAFLEANDLSNPVEADTSAFDMLDEYLTFFDANDDSLQNFVAAPFKHIESGGPVSGQATPTEMCVNEGTRPAFASNDQLLGCNNDDASSSEETKKFGSDLKYPFLKQASHLLENIPAPPAFAAEFPTKDAASYLGSISQSSSSVRVTAGVIQIRNLTRTGDGTDWSYGKYGDYNIILSFGLSRRDSNSANLESEFSIHPGKALSSMSRGWFYFLFFWVLVLSMSFKIGTYVYAR